MEASRASEGWEQEDAFRTTISKEGVCWGYRGYIAAASWDQKAAVLLWTVLLASPSDHWNLHRETEFLDLPPTLQHTHTHAPRWEPAESLGQVYTHTHTHTHS